MGVQKSRKSTKYTKYSLLKASYNPCITNHIKQRIYLKYAFKKKEVFSLKNKSSNQSFFFFL